MRHSSAVLLLGFAAAASPTLQAEDLLVRNVAPHLHTVVYELPGVPPEVVRGFASSLARNFPQAKLIDGAATTETELREKLKGSFLLYTTLHRDARLLHLAAQPTPLKLDNGHLQWGDFSGPAKDLRLEFIGRNPYGGGYSVVVAVGSPALFTGGEESPGYSYAIKNADGTLRKGTYDEDFNPTSYGRMKLTDARADVREFFGNLEHLHADPFARVTQAEY